MLLYAANRDVMCMKIDNNSNTKSKITKLKVTKNIYLVAGSVSPVVSITGVMITPPSITTDFLFIALGIYASMTSFIKVHYLNEDIKKLKKK